jgi:hypothetical protein
MCPVVGGDLASDIEIKKQMSIQTWILGALLLICIFAGGFMLSSYLSSLTPRKSLQSSQYVSHESLHQSQSQPQPNIIRSIEISNAEQVVPPVYPSKLPEYPLRQVTTGYQQVGVLVLEKNGNDEPMFLPLFGRKLGNRDRWEYYCSSDTDKYHLMRLPVRYNNRECEDDVGCDEIYNGQQVSVPDYGDKTFVARMYKYNFPRY